MLVKFKDGTEREIVLTLGADLRRANLGGANLGGANLEGADLEGADLRAYGNMRELRTLQFDAWAIGYTYDTLQIGCQRQSIKRWRGWNTPEGRQWISTMAPNALEWADRNLDLILKLIERNPAAESRTSTRRR